MANGQQTDVSLVVRARDEASKAISAIETALQDLLSTQKQLATGSQGTAAGINQTVAALAGLDKAYSQIAGAADKGAAGFQRQLSTLAGNQAALAALTKQIDAARAAQERLGSFVGPRTQGQAQQYAGVTGEIKNLETSIKALSRTVDGQQVGLTRSASTLADVARQTKLVGAVETFARTEAEAFTRSLEKQGQAAEKNAIALSAIQKSTDSRGGKSAADSAEVFTRSGLTDIEKDIAATQRAAEAERDRAAAIRMTEAAMRARARSEGNGGSAGKAADTAFAQMLREEEEAAHQAAQADDELVAAATKLRAAMNPLAAIQDNLNRELAEAAKLYRAGKISAEELAGAELLLKKNADQAAQSLGRQNAGGGKPSLFGLKPYEIQNLGYQVNDVVTQLASGTSLSQTLAQQGGQLIQIFPKVGASIVAAFSNPWIAAAAVSVGILVIGMKELGDEADRVRGFLGQLAASADGKNYGAEQLNAAAEALDRYGLSASEAVDAVKVFFKEGIRQDQIEQFGEAAKNLSDVMGVDLKQAVKEVADAFSGGYDAVKKLDDSYNFLTAAQRESIKTMFEEGRASEARRMAFELFAKQQDEAAKNARGPWAGAVKELGAAWQEFKSFLADAGVFKLVMDQLSKLGVSIQGIIQDLRELIGLKSSTPAGAPQVSGNMAKVKSDLADAEKRMAELQQKGPTDQLYQYRIRAVQTEIDGLKERARLLGDTVNPDSQALSKTRADRLAEIAARRDEARTTKDMAGAQRISEAGRLAFEAEMRRSGDVAIAQAEKELAVERETRDVKRDQAAAAKEAAAERERAIQQFNSRAIGAEGGAGNNPNSTATGFGQFLNATWLDQFRKVFSDEARTMSQDQILALRQNSTIAKAIIDNYARENAKFLESFGAKVTAGNLYLAHFLGAGGAKKILTAQGDTPVDQLLSPAVMNANKGYLYASKGGRARTADELEKFIAGRVGDTGAAQSAGQVEIAKLEDDRADKQQKFNLAVEQENAERQRTTEALTAQSTLQNTALIAAQKVASVNKAEADLRDRIDKANENLKPGQERLQVTQEQIDKTRELAAAEFDAQHAREVAAAKLNEVQQPVDDLTAKRDALRQQIETARELGQTGLADALVPQLDTVNAQLIKALETLKAFYAGLSDVEKIQLNLTADKIAAIGTQIDVAKQKSFEWNTILGISGQTIAQTFASTAVSAIDKFAQAVANGQNAFGALKDAFLGFAADFLRQIAQMIMQQIIFNLVSGLLKGITGGIGGGSGGAGTSLGAVAGLKAHDGGIIGGAGPQSIAVNPAWFASAARYHTGGIAGLKPNEVPAVLERGEEVLTRNDPRHAANGGGAAGGGQSVKNVILFDPAEAMAAALNTKVGEKALLTFVRANSRAFQSAMG